MTEQLDRNALKVQALTQRIAEIVAEYENKLADFRVEHTVTANDLNGRLSEASQTIDSLQTHLAEYETIPNVQAPEDE